MVNRIRRHSRVYRTKKVAIARRIRVLLAEVLILFEKISGSRIKILHLVIFPSFIPFIFATFEIRSNARVLL